MLTSLHQAYVELLSPSQDLIHDLRKIKGDILILGAGGKMGPSLCKLAVHSIQLAGTSTKIIAVARFTEAHIKRELSDLGIIILTGDLLDDAFLDSLPEVENVLYLAGTKFGTTGNEAYTWAMNTYLPGRVALKFKKSRIVVFSTGNVYPFTDIDTGGATEDVKPAPIGEYGMSCLGRERMFQYYGSKHQTRLLIYRLNYAIDVSYGILTELAKSILHQIPIDLRMGYVNIIWQKDANEIAIRSLLHCSYPYKVLNVTGPKTLSVRYLAERLGVCMNLKPEFSYEEQPTALLSNAVACHTLFKTSLVSVDQMIKLIADWILQGGQTINKPTHFSQRDGHF